MYACMAFAGAILLALILPETKGRSLEELEGLFARPWIGDSGAPINYNIKTVQYVHIRGLNRDGRESELDSPEWGQLTLTGELGDHISLDPPDASIIIINLFCCSEPGGRSMPGVWQRIHQWGAVIDLCAVMEMGKLRFQTAGGSLESNLI